METRERKGKGKESIKDRMNRWISKSPKLEKFVDTGGYYFKHPDKFSDKVNEIYSKATNNREVKTMTEIGHKFKELLRMIKLTLNGQYQGVPKGRIYLWAIGVMYILSPIDLIPDFLPVIGLVDDAALLIWLVKNANDEVEKFMQWEITSGIKTVNPSY